MRDADSNAPQAYTVVVIMLRETLGIQSGSLKALLKEVA
jgi:hypothetical protein